MPLVPIRRLMPLALALAACGGGVSTSNAEPVKPAEDCTAYANALRACFSSTGAPTRSADELAASALAPRDETTRARMNTECARDRVELRAACK